MNTEELSKALRELPRVSADTVWGRHCIALRARVEIDDISKFLNWSTIQATIFLRDQPFIAKEFAELRNSDDWPWWENGLRESHVGTPPMLGYHSTTSPNRVNQCYYLLQFEKATGKNVEDFEGPIVEFGGGYGLMCAILHKMGYRGEYYIYDLPEFSLLQQYYLDQVNVKARFLQIDHHGRFDMPPESCELLIAAFSLSEAPIELRNAFLQVLKPRWGLIAYQPEFEGYDNMHYFENIRYRTWEVSWGWPNPYNGNIHYLFGGPEEEVD